MSNREICGECKWHKVIKDYNDSRYEAWACDNEDSPYYTYYTEYTDTCECFEQRGAE